MRIFRRLFRVLLDSRTVLLACLVGGAAPYLGEFHTPILIVAPATLVWLVWVLLGFVARQRWRWMALFLCPALVTVAASLLIGVVGYCTGTAELAAAGLPGVEFDNLDPVCRCHCTTSGCVVDGTEVLTHTPNNFAVFVLTELFGPMPGAYRGPYPTRAQAYQLLQSSRSRVTLADLHRGDFIVDRTRIRLGWDGDGYRLYWASKAARLHAALLDRTLLLLGDFSGDVFLRVVLIDLEGQELIAVYDHPPPGLTVHLDDGSSAQI